MFEISPSTIAQVKKYTHQYGHRVLRFLRYLEEEDLVQEALLRIWLIGRDKTYMMNMGLIRTITANVVIDEMRKKNRLGRVRDRSRMNSVEFGLSDDGLVHYEQKNFDPLNDPANAYAEKERLLLWFAALSPQQQDLARMLLFHDTAREVSDMMGYTEGRISQLRSAIPRIDA